MRSWHALGSAPDQGTSTPAMVPVTLAVRLLVDSAAGHEVVLGEVGVNINDFVCLYIRVHPRLA